MVTRCAQEDSQSAKGTSIVIQMYISQQSQLLLFILRLPPRYDMGPSKMKAKIKLGEQIV